MAISTVSPISNTVADGVYEEIHPVEGPTYFTISARNGVDTSKPEEIGLNVCTAYGLIPPEPTLDRESLDEDGYI